MHYVSDSGTSAVDTSACVILAVDISSQKKVHKSSIQMLGLKGTMKFPGWIVLTRNQ